MPVPTQPAQLVSFLISVIRSGETLTPDEERQAREAAATFRCPVPEMIPGVTHDIDGNEW